MNSFTIRNADESDIPLIRELTLQVWPQTYATILSEDQISYMPGLMYHPDALRKQMSERSHQFLILSIDGDYCGFASWGSQTTAIARLHKLYVLPIAQGKGAGKALIESIITEARKKGHGVLELNVNKYNPAYSFYLRHGFEVVREEVIDIGNGYVMDDYVMQKHFS